MIPKYRQQLHVEELEPLKGKKLESNELKPGMYVVVHHTPSEVSKYNGVGTIISAPRGGYPYRMVQIKLFHGHNDAYPCDSYHRQLEGLANIGIYLLKDEAIMCPVCQEQQQAEDDYLCEDCRFGGRPLVGQKLS